MSYVALNAFSSSGFRFFKVPRCGFWGEVKVWSFEFNDAIDAECRAGAFVFFWFCFVMVVCLVSDELIS